MRLLNILKENNIIKISPSQSLSSAITKLRTSHDAAFIFDDQGKFLGLINPYHTLIKNSYPVNLPVEKCLFHPPKIFINYPITKVCQLFIESKIHYLPIFSQGENKFLGIISVRRVFSHLKKLPIYKENKVKDLLKTKYKPLETIFFQKTVKDALSIFKNKKVSKLIVVDENQYLKGILSYYDLIDYLILPKDKEKKGDRLGEKSNFYHLPIKTLMKTYVLTCNEEDSLEKVIDLILEKKIGSVLILKDDKKTPKNIITSTDLLRFYLKKEKKEFFKKLKEKFASFFPS